MEKHNGRFALGKGKHVSSISSYANFVHAFPLIKKGESVNKSPSRMFNIKKRNNNNNNNNSNNNNNNEKYYI